MAQKNNSPLSDLYYRLMYGSSHEDELKGLLAKYIWDDANTDRETVTRLKQLLKSTPADIRYSVLNEVRFIRNSLNEVGYIRAKLNEVGHLPCPLNEVGYISSELNEEEIPTANWTAVHCAVKSGNLETVQHMVRGLTSQQLYDLLCFQRIVCNWAAICWFAALGHEEIGRFLISNLTKEHRYELLKEPAHFGGETILHEAAARGNQELIQLLANSVSTDHYKQLLELQDDKNETAVKTQKNFFTKS